MEREKGVSGFRDTQEQLEKVATEKADLDAKKGQTLEEMSALVQQLSMKISDRKARLAPIIKELRPLRMQSQDLQVDYEARKSSYDTLLLQLESSMSRLEQVRGGFAK
jgi:intraflagellar transport protein 81